jgi:hypothetical protein
MFGKRNTVQVALTRVTILAAALTGAASASADGGPILSPPGGCTLQCIQKALVTTTSTAAKVEIRTAVPTRVVLTARRLSTTGGLVAGPDDASASHHLLRTARTLFLVGLQPKTTYRISLSATDAEGRAASRSGTFATRPVAVNVDPGPGSISSGLGCSAKCIQKAVPVAIGPTAAVFEFGTDTPARMALVISRDAGGHDVASNSSSGGLVTKWTASATLLDAGTKYFLFVRATDASGRTNERHWTFDTVEQHVQVTLWKIKVISDGDKGRARGELRFEYWAGGTRIGDDGGFHKRKSGDVFSVHASGTSRPGLTTTLAANGRAPTFDLRVYAEECDGPARMKNCAIEAREPGWIPHGGGDFAGDDFATAGGVFSLAALRTPGGLPPNFGTSMPAGHDGYFVFETTEHHVKFRVYAFLDVFYA